MTTKIEFVIKKFPQLAGREDFIQGILDIRQAFGLERVPFRIITPDFDSGSLERFYVAERSKINQAKMVLKKKLRKNNGRKQSGSPGWKRY